MGLTDHIIKAAKEAGGTTYTNRHHDGTACAFGPEALERFYAIAYRAGLEAAADEAIDIVARHGGSVEIEAAIREKLHPDHFGDANQMAAQPQADTP